MLAGVGGGPGDTTAGMGSSAAEVEAGDGTAVLRPSSDRTVEKQLFKIEVAVENVAFGESVGAFQIERGENLAGNDGTRDIGRVLGDFAHDTFAQQFAIFVPSALAQFVGDILHEAGHDVLAGGRERGVGIRSDDAIDPQLFGNFSKLGDVVAAFGEFERGNEGEQRPLLRVVAGGRAGEAGLFSKDHVDFGAGAVHFNAADGLDEIGGEIAFRHHAEKSAFGIGIREHDAGSDFGAVFEDDGAHSSFARIDLLDRGAGADFRPEASGRLSHSAGDRAHAAHDVSVEALLFVLAAAEEMKEQAEGGARLVRASVFAVDVVGQKQRFYFF